MNNKTEEKVGVLGVSLVIAAICSGVIFFVSSQFDTGHKLSPIDSLRVEIKQLHHEIDSLKSVWDTNWQYALETDSIALEDNKWIRAFKQEYPWIDNRIKEDSKAVE